MNPFSPARNFVMHQPVTALTVRRLILLLLAVPLVLLCRKAAEHAGHAKRRGVVYGVLGVLLLCVVGNATALLSVCGFAPVGIPLEPFMYSMFDAWVFAVGLLLLLLAHRRAVRGRKDKPRQNRISLLLALLVAADLWRCHYNIVWWQNNQLEADYAANPLGLYVDALFVLFALLNLAAVTLPLWDVFVRGRRAESAMPSASRREPV